MISGYLTRFGKSYVHLVFLLYKFFSIGAPTNSGAWGPPTAKSGPDPDQSTRKFFLSVLLQVMYKATSVENIVVLTQCTDPNTFRVKI